MTDFSDVIIVGAGPSGLAMACSLALAGFDVAIFDGQSQQALEDAANDGREIAMTHLSKTILEELGVWQHIPAEFIHPLNEAKVFNGVSDYSLHFERTDDSNAPLGFLVANSNIRKALYKRCIELDRISLHTESTVVSIESNNLTASVTLDGNTQYSADLLLAADSRFSGTRRMMGISAKMKDFGRIMIVANITHSSSHHNMAQEWFKYGLTCAILPLADNNASIVLTVPAARAYEYMQMNEAQFLERVSTLLEGRLGELKTLGDRKEYPLVGAFADSFIAQRFALIGDAAVGMHPVTAHGFNLGLRSVDTLCAQIKKAAIKGESIASKKVLGTYQLRHRLLAKPLYEGTNAIVRLFTDDSALSKVVRKGALILGNHLPGFKQLVTHRLTQQR